MKKAKIHSHDDLGSAIDTTYKRLKECVERNTDLDAEVKVGSPPQSGFHMLTSNPLFLVDVSSS